MVPSWGCLNSNLPVLRMIPLHHPLRKVWLNDWKNWFELNGRRNETRGVLVLSCIWISHSFLLLYELFMTMQRNLLYLTPPFYICVSICYIFFTLYNMHSRYTYHIHMSNSSIASRQLYQSLESLLFQCKEKCLPSLVDQSQNGHEGTVLND